MNNNSMSQFSTKQICVTGTMVAFIFIMTIVPRIPIPLGYAHLGDAAIFLCVYFIGRREGVIAGCIGSAMADFFGGFPIWVLPTLLIKFLMAETFWYIVKDKVKHNKKFSIVIVMGLVFALLVMTAGYTLFGAALYCGIEVGLMSAPGLLIKSAVNMIAFYFLFKIFKNLKM